MTDTETPARETLAYRTWLDYKTKTEDVASVYRARLKAIDERFAEAQRIFAAARKLRDEDAEKARQNYLAGTDVARKQRQAILKAEGGESRAAVRPGAFRP